MAWNPLLVAANLSLAVGLPVDVPAIKRLALVIGNGDYPSPLVTSRQDADSMATTLAASTSK